MGSIFEWLFSKEAIVSIAVILVMLLVLFFAERISKKNSKELSGEKATFQKVLNDIIRAVIILSGILVVLQVNGVNITSLIAGLGIVSALIGLALQDYLKDIIMGIRIMSDRYFSLGDCVEYNGHEGVVVSFNMKVTKIRDISDDSVIAISNRNISEIRRLSDWLDIDVPVSYEKRAEEIRPVLLKICKKIALDSRVESCDLLGIQSFEESSVMWRIRIICPPAERPPTRRCALSVIYDGLFEAGIVIPYNQLDVHLDK